MGGAQPLRLAPRLLHHRRRDVDAQHGTGGPGHRGRREESRAPAAAHVEHSGAGPRRGAFDQPPSHRGEELDAHPVVVGGCLVECLGDLSLVRRVVYLAVSVRCHRAQRADGLSYPRRARLDSRSTAPTAEAEAGDSRRA